MQQLDLEALAMQLNRPLPPVETWDPPLTGIMDLRIARDGTWFHEGSPIQRQPLVRLFSTILRRDADDQYYLVTPAEKWRIQVDNVPFTAVLLQVTGQGQDQQLLFTTNLGDQVNADAEYPLQVDYHPSTDEPSPYLLVRARLWALLSRAVFVELAEFGEEREVAGEICYGVWSGGVFFRLGSLQE